MQCTNHVRFTPNSDRESEIPQKVMSALPLKADICGATRNVRFGPIAGTFARLLDQLVSACEQWQGYRQAERLGSLEADDELEFCGLLDRQIRGLGAFQNLVHEESGAKPKIITVRRIGHERAGFHGRLLPNHGQPVLRRELRNVMRVGN